MYDNNIILDDNGTISSDKWDNDGNPVNLRNNNTNRKHELIKLTKSGFNKMQVYIEIINELLCPEEIGEYYIEIPDYKVSIMVSKSIRMTLRNTIVAIEPDLYLIKEYSINKLLKSIKRSIYEVQNLLKKVKKRNDLYNELSHEKKISLNNKIWQHSNELINFYYDKK